MRVTVQADEHAFDLDVQPSDSPDTVLRLVREAAVEHALPRRTSTVKQMLHFGGTQLRGHNALGGYDVRDGAQLELREPSLIEEERGPGDDARPVLPDGVVLAALEEIGANPVQQLTAQERQELDINGFVCIGQVLTDEQCDEMRRRLDAQLVLEGDTAGGEVHQQEGADRLSDLNNKPGLNHDGLFDVPLTHPKVLAAMRHVLGDWIALSSLNFRQALPGDGHQAFHTDWGPNPDATLEPPQFSVCNSLWMIDEFTETNGATRVLPGSHLTGRTGVIFCCFPAVCWLFPTDLGLCRSPRHAR